MGYWDIVVPTATTNLITNPSGELNTTGWTAQGTNTIARSSTQSFKGDYSFLCTYQDNNTFARFALTFPTVSVTYKYTAWVWVPAAFDGAGVTLGIANLTGATATIVSQWTEGVDNTDDWVFLETTIAMSTDVTGDVSIETSSVTAGKFIYVDAVQVEQQSTYTTYCDGDQPGCKWQGARHGSKSTRAITSWQGGLIKDLETDYYFKVFQNPGAGLTAVQNNVSEYATIPGSLHQNTKKLTRRWALTGAIQGSTFANLHARRKSLIDLFDPSRFGGSDPVLLRYRGAATVKEIVAYYDGGMEWNDPDHVNEYTSIRLLSSDPNFYSVGDNSTALSLYDSATFRTIAAKISGAWTELGPPNASGSYSIVYDIAYFNAENVYVCGNFTNFDNIASADYIVKYNSVTGVWSSITGSGSADNAIHTLAVSPNGDLYAGGLFTTINGVACAKIAKYDPSTGTWSALGTGCNGTVWRLRWGYADLLYCAGEFTTANGVTVNRVATWNGTTFAAYGSGTAGIGATAVYDLLPDNDGNMYATGDFTTLGGGGDAQKIAKYTASAGSWAAISTGLDGGGDEGRVLCFLPNGDLIVGGNFDTAGGVTVNNICRYNGRGFFALSTGVDDAVYSLSYSVDDAKLYAGGAFTSAGGLTLGDRVAIWNGSKWELVDIDLPGSPNVWAIYTTGQDIWLGFSTSGVGYFSNPVTVTNNGNEPAYPVISITRTGGTSATLQAIINETTGKKLLFNTSLNIGQTLEIDLHPDKKAMRVYGGNGIGAEDAGWTMLPGSDITSFNIVRGDNTISTFTSIAGSPTFAGFIRFIDTFGTLDG